VSVVVRMSVAVAATATAGSVGVATVARPFTIAVAIALTVVATRGPRRLDRRAVAEMGRWSTVDGRHVARA